MEPAFLVSIVSGIVAITCAYFTFRASTKATNVEEKKVDQEAYDRAIEFYQKQLDEMTKQIDRATSQADRLQIQLEKVSSQLGAEKDVSNALKSQVEILKAQVDVLKGTIADLQSRVGRRIGPRGHDEHEDLPLSHI